MSTNEWTQRTIGVCPFLRSDGGWYMLAKVCIQRGLRPFPTGQHG